MSAGASSIDSMLEDALRESGGRPAKSGQANPASDPDVDLWGTTAKSKQDSSGSPGSSPISELASGAWEGTKNLAAGLYDSAKWALSQDTPQQGEALLTHIGTALNASDDQLTQAHDAWQRGDHLEALGHLGRSIPGIGPASGALGDIAGGTPPTYDASGKELTPFIPPRPWYAAGQAIPLIASIFTPDLVEGGVNAVGATGQAIRNMGKINPVKYSSRIFVPGEANATFSATTPDALRDIKTYGNPNIERVSGSPVAETEPAAQQAIDHLQNVMGAWVDHGMQAGARINGDILVNATRKAIPDLIWTRDPLHAQAIVNEAQAAFGGKTFPVDRVRDWLRTGNASKFYSQIGYKQNAASLTGTAPAIEAAQTNAMRAELYPQLDVAGNGAGPREIQNRTAALINARNNAFRRTSQVSGEGGASTLEGMGNFATAGTKIVGAPFQQGDIASSVRQLKNPMEGKSDAMLRALYKQLDPAPPLPMPPGPHPGWVHGPQASYVRQTSSAGALSGPARLNPGYNPRQLPEGTAPFTQGTITLNPSAQRGPSLARALPPGSPTQGQGVIQIPPAGAAEWLHGPDFSYRQAGPFAPREGAAPADTSYVRSVPATPHPPAETPPGVLPPSQTQRVIDMQMRPGGGGQAGPEWWAAQPPTRPEIQARYQELFNRAENLSPQRPVQVPETGPPEKISRWIDAQDNIAKQVLGGRSWKDATPPERDVINSLIREGYGSAPQDMIVLKDPETGQLYSVPRPQPRRSGGVIGEPLRQLERRTVNRKAILSSLGG